MRSTAFTFRQLFAILFLTFAALLAATALQAWTGPTDTAPGSNVPAPLNVGSTDQVKNGGLSLNSLLVSGNAAIYNSATAEKFGINTASPVVALDVNGSVKLGNGGEACQSVSAGVLRYNTSSNIVEYCNGTKWCPISGCTAPTATVIYLNSTTWWAGNTWTVPANWDSSNNTIEVIGGGGGGGGGTFGGSGGGGGGYSKMVNVSLTPSSNVRVRVGAGGAAGNGSDGTAGGDTYLCNSTTSCASITGTAVVVGAKGGAKGLYNSSSTGGAGGAASGGVGSTKFSGGNGGSGDGRDGADGGGGAAGPNGNGGNGGDDIGAGVWNGGGGGGADGGTNGASAVAGGAGGAGANGGGAGGNGSNSSASPGGVGFNGSEWGASYGAGGGGGGGDYDGGASVGGGGGLYGGGGASGAAGAAGGAGAPGIIIITYYP